MASRVAFALALVGLCLASCNGVEGRKLTGEDGLKVETNLKSQYKSHANSIFKERPYVTSKPAMVNVTNASPQDGNNYIIHFSLWESTNQYRYYGTEVSINAWALPDVKSPQSSFSGVWLQSGKGDETNVIMAGWHVYPDLYGDSKTRFFILWTADHLRHTGCYNLLCKGFVMKNNTVVPGAPLSPLSTFDGDQYHVVFTVYRNGSTGDWWLRYHKNDDPIEVGYWPNSLFTSLGSYADVVQWGGLVSYPSGGAGPPMGSGRQAADGFGRAAYIKSIMFVQDDGSLYHPHPLTIYRRNDDPHCFEVTQMAHSSSKGWNFFFGGPAGCRG